MTTRLTDLHIDEGSFVDKGANPAADIVFFKRAPEGGDSMQKAGKTISSATGAALSAVMESMRSAMDRLTSVVGDDVDEDEGDEQMPISEDMKKGLSEDVRKYVDDLESKAGEADDKIAKLEAQVQELSKSEPVEEDILKGASEEVRKAVEDARAEAAAATEIAKSERELRISKQYQDEAKELDKIGDSEAVAKMLRAADEQGDEQGKALRETLKAAQAKIDANDRLTKELGRSGGDNGSDAFAKIEARAAEIAKSGDLTKEQAMDQFLASDEGQELYAAHKSETMKGSE